MSEHLLFADFPKVSSKEWKQKIQFDLKGADYNEALVWESLEGIKVKPFYHSEDLQNLKTVTLPKDHDWKIGQSIYAGDLTKGNAKIKDCISRGAESLIITIPDDSSDYSILFEGIDLSPIPLHFQFKSLNPLAVSRLLEFLDTQKPKTFLHLDIIGNLAQNGNWFHNLEKDHQLLEEILALKSKFQFCAILGVNMGLYQNSGANMVQQLAYGISHANEYMNHFMNGLTSEIGNTLQIQFKVAIGANYFFEIAKLRALRWLWSSLCNSYKINSDCHILALPSKRNKTLYDYNVNLLRTTSECMAAILGGADTVCNMPYDAIYHKDNEFGDRIARNQLLLLKNESYFSNGAYAAEGSYYIEALTEQLAEKALALFKQIETAGGFLSELKKGNIQKKIKESGAKEQLLFDEGEITLLGTNKFQNPEDRMKDNLELYPFVKIHARKTIIEPIIEKRLSENIEKNRLDHE